MAAQITRVQPARVHGFLDCGGLGQDQPPNDAHYDAWWIGRNAIHKRPREVRHLPREVRHLLCEVRDPERPWAALSDGHIQHANSTSSNIQTSSACTVL